MGGGFDGASNLGTPYQQPGAMGGMAGMGQLPGLGGPAGSPNGNSVGGMMNNVTASPPFGTNDGGIPNQMMGGMGGGAS